ncbi:MAG: hypothetical protein HC836_47080 [Richelia sp. RM2_1_2]|nr:hypothetical protein [Richelia sp. RM2_1_2]
MKDVLENVKTEIKCLDHGFVRLIDCMPRLVEDDQTADSAIVQAARVSYGAGTKKTNEDRGLIRYLMRHRHSTPFEMVEFKFLCKMPIFVARQFIRHRTACLSGNVELWFDEPASLMKNKRKLKKMSIEEFYKKWHYGAKPFLAHRKKDTYIDKIDSNFEYSIAELSSIVKRTKSYIRNMIKSGSLMAIKDGDSYKIKGENWKNWAEKEFKHVMPCKNNLKKMQLRMCDEMTGEILYTNITDIWQNGKKMYLKLNSKMAIKSK